MDLTCEKDARGRFANRTLSDTRSNAVMTINKMNDTAISGTEPFRGTRNELPSLELPSDSPHPIRRTVTILEEALKILNADDHMILCDPPSSLSNREQLFGPKRDDSQNGPSDYSAHPRQ